MFKLTKVITSLKSTITLYDTEFLLPKIDNVSWAFASVDKDGEVWVFEIEPELREESIWVVDTGDTAKVGLIEFEGDCKDSLVEL